MTRKEHRKVSFISVCLVIAFFTLFISVKQAVPTAEANVWDTLKEGPFEYSYNSGTREDDGSGICLERIDPTLTTDPTIPSEINGSPVTKLGSNIYYGWTNVTEVVIPETVVELHETFRFGRVYNTSIETITVKNPKMICSQEDFLGTGWLKNLPDGPVYLDGIFLGKKSDYTIKSTDDIPPAVETITVKPGTVNIAKEAFKGYASTVKEVVLPDTLQIIQHSAFSGCGKLTKINLPDSVTEIGQWAFYNCRSLKEITLPKNLTKLSHQVFKNCAGLESVTIPEGLTTIPDETFSGCTSLKNVTFPEGLTEIARNAFENCESLTEIHLPKSVKSISYAFNRCKNITKIFISDLTAWCNLKIEGSHPFDSVNYTGSGDLYLNGEKITELTIPDGVEEISSYIFKYCTSIQKVTIPDSVKRIGDEAFYHCTALREVMIPDSVIQIGGLTFAGCKALQEVTIPASVQMIGEQAFTHPTVIRCEKDSVAHQWAMENNRTFLLLSELGQPGDVDGDGTVTSGDARLALRASVGLEQYAPGSGAFTAADVDHNGEIGSDDARLILRASVGLEQLT